MTKSAADDFAKRRGKLARNCTCRFEFVKRWLRISTCCCRSGQFEKSLPIEAVEILINAIVLYELDCRNDVLVNRPPYGMEHRWSSIAAL